MNYGNILELHRIHAGYREKEVLSGINLSIPKGITSLLIGPNGAGKSTLLKVIAGILKPYSGIVIFDKKDITSISVEKRVFMGIGYLKQTQNIFPNLSVLENLKLAGFGMSKDKLNKRTEQLLSYFPFLKSELDKRAGLLSGGERQALGITMVLIKPKKLLLLDEPTGGLMPKHAQVILQALHQIKKDESVSILMVEHNLKAVINWVDEIIAMREGKIIDKSNSPKEILKDKNFLEKIYF